MYFKWNLWFLWVVEALTFDRTEYENIVVCRTMLQKLIKKYFS